MWHVRRGKKKKTCFYLQTQQDLLFSTWPFPQMAVFPQCRSCLQLVECSVNFVRQGKERNKRTDYHHQAGRSQASKKGKSKRLSVVVVFFSLRTLCLRCQKQRLDANKWTEKHKKRAWAKNSEAALWYLKKKKICIVRQTFWPHAPPLSVMGKPNRRRRNKKRKKTRKGKQPQFSVSSHECK